MLQLFNLAALGLGPSFSGVPLHSSLQSTYHKEERNGVLFFSFIIEILVLVEWFHTAGPGELSASPDPGHVNDCTLRVRSRSGFSFVLI